MTLDRVLTVTDLARGGAGVARTEEGQVVFIPYTAPGDRVRVRLVEQKKRYFQGELLEILEPSSDRITPKCAVFGQCGGCQWQHLPYPLQWKTKAKGVLHALERVGLFESATNQIPVDEIPAEQVWEYRNRVQLRGFEKEIGFLRRSSREWVPIERCEIARREINGSLEETRALGAELPRPYKVEVEVTENGDIRRTWNSSHASSGFRQIHDQQNELLKDWVKKQLQTEGLTPKQGILFDLYGGSGNLSLGLQGSFREIHCIDTGAPLLPSGPDSSSQMSSYHFHKKPVLNWVLKESGKPSASGFDSINSAILDPPRAGLDTDFKDIAGAIEKLNVKRLIHVGCDVDAWVRDISRWAKRGWKIERLMLIDLFPQTVHVESVAVLSL
ncbi:MAG: class I SAM-dependent RNA methyltransferase [Bdellovibrio sp.]|nr:class I SAM-dependent RNA methyltransferase [Bdellovibrio sp.]